MNHDDAETPVDLEPVNALLASLAPSTVRVGSRRIHSSDLRGLLDVESTFITKAVPKRQREFASGRALVRELMGSAAAVPVAANRAPIFPAGVRGSLAHDSQVAIAAITRDPRIVALGIDIEPISLLSDQMADVILRDDDPTIDAHLAFTLKEAVYKAWSALGGRVLEHHDVRLEVGDRTFRGLVTNRDVADDDATAETTFDGEFGSAAGRWISLVVVDGERLRSNVRLT